MTREELVLAAMAASNGAVHTPVQMQKLLFLIEKSIPEHIGGPHFDFEPYDYGPFDPKVYWSLDTLASGGLVEVLSEPDLRWKKYKLTEFGIQQGKQVLSSLHVPIQTYLEQLSSWVRRLSFSELVSSIYSKYPEMRVNSVFRG